MPNPLNDKLQTLDEERVANLYKTVFATEEGQLVLEDLRNRCFIKIPTPTEESPYTTYFNEGKRSVVLHIESQINYEKSQERTSEE